ncbi:MAG: helix-turn-helix transcriptional regulator [Halobacteriovoraceae bacterium]|nr:helix-turn-helix transcriptional regulator [Halobacteriovoraceae bacterium]
MNDFHQRLLKLRKKQGLTIKQVAEELNISPSTYRDWEQGAKISGEPYSQLAKLFKVSINYLLNEEKTSSDEIIHKIKRVKIILSEAEEMLSTL